MLDHVMDVVEKDGNFDAVFLHVQINNDSAINFYKKFGFDIVETKEQYYKRIEPADAHVLEKRLRESKNINGNSGGGSEEEATTTPAVTEE
jgi:ribosomal protein S18 acetylase RimI-like enzyme